MSPAQAVELAYLITEHGRTQKLLDALVNAVDCTIDEGAVSLMVNEGGIVTYPELPHMLMREMFERGVLLTSVQYYLKELNAALDDGFHIIIEKQSPPLNQIHQGSMPE